jgi:hypothetical protein
VIHSVNDALRYSVMRASVYYWPGCICAGFPGSEFFCHWERAFLLRATNCFIWLGRKLVGCEFMVLELDVAVFPRGLAIGVASMAAWRREFVKCVTAASISVWDLSFHLTFSRLRTSAFYVSQFVRELCSLVCGSLLYQR